MTRKTNLTCVALWGVIGVGVRGAEATRTPKRVAASTPTASKLATAPAWASDARWYQIDVARFANVQPGNDANGVRGDLQGLQSRLPYLKALGVNVLYLTSIFQPRAGSRGRIDWRHIDPSVSDTRVSPMTSESTPKQEAGRLTPGDRVFLALVKTAHDAGFRVILDLAVGETPGSIGSIAECVKDLLNLSHRWMDPDGDGKYADGVDGWVVRGADRLPHAFVRQWSTQVRAWNREVLLVADVDEAPAGLIGSEGFDTLVGHAKAQGIRDFVGAVPKPMAVKPFLAELQAIAQGPDERGRSIAPCTLSDLTTGRFFRPVTAAATHGRSSDTPADGQPSSDPKSVFEKGQNKPSRDRKGALLSAKPGASLRAEALNEASHTPSEKRPSSTGAADEAASRWRLATVLQHFLPGAPMTYFGDEIGWTGGHGRASPVPMASPDAAGSSPAAERHGEFASLIQWLHGRRDVDVPLRRGALRIVMVDADRKVFALARTMPGDEVILVVNYGAAKQKIMLKAGRPGGLAALLTPVLKPRRLPPALAKRLPRPVQGIAPLLMGASRQRVDANGRVRIWVDPMAIRYILLQE